MFIEDYGLWLLLAREHPFAVIPDVVAEKRFHSNNASVVEKRPIFRDTLQLMVRERAACRSDPIAEAERSRTRDNAYAALGRTGPSATSSVWSRAIPSTVRRTCSRPAATCADGRRHLGDELVIRRSRRPRIDTSSPARRRSPLPRLAPTTEAREVPIRNRGPDRPNGTAARRRRTSSATRP